jgi:hypothetical protein
MVLTKEDRIALLEKARLVKANKKAERDAEKPIPKKGRPKKPESKILDLGDVADETNVEELAEDIKNMHVKEEPVLESTNEMKLKTELPQQEQEQEEEQEVEIIEEVIKKKKKPKKKIIRRYIEPSSSEDEQEIIEEFIKKKSKPKSKISPRYEPYARAEQPTPIQLTPPTLNLFCY